MEGSPWMIFFAVLLCLIENFLPNPVKHNKLLEIVIKGLDGCVAVVLAKWLLLGGTGRVCLLLMASSVSKGCLNIILSKMVH